MGRKGKPRTPLAAIGGTNPNYKAPGTGTQYTHNCQRVVYAFEERMRGYNVEAQPYQARNDPMGGGNWKRVYKGQTWESNLGRTKDKVVDGIHSRMTAWGDGARAIIYVKWAGVRSAHVFNVVQENGKTHAYDAQSGKRVSLTRYINLSQPTKTMISRVDNLTERNPIMEKILKRGTK